MTCVAVVIVNYKTPDLVTQCLTSVAAERSDDLRLKVYVGDADSQDGSVETISAFIAAQGYDDFCTCYAIGRNGGFAYGNNHILERWVLDDPEVDHVHFLNPDTYVHPGAIAALVRMLESRPGMGAAGSRLENPDGSLRSYAFRFPAPWREFFRGARLAAAERLLPSSEISMRGLMTSRPVDWVTGASFMMPRPALDKVGLMDSRYFLYFEEVELMSRVQRAGLAIWHVSDSRVVHLQGAATGVKADAAPKRVPAYWYQSRFKFFCDRYGRARAIWANFVFLIGDIVYRAHRLARRKPIADVPYLWRDFLAHGFSLPPC